VKNLLILLLLFSAGGLYIASAVPAGPHKELEAQVISRTTRSGPTGNIGILIVQLDTGSKVTVELPTHASASSGDRIQLRSYERLLFADVYQFAGKLIAQSEEKPPGKQ